jgi:CubicO group peptidase (beta-lactamase class C family)
MTESGVIQAAMDQAVRDGVFPGGVLAVRLSGELRCLVAAGRLSSDAADHVRVSTIYDLASLTKPLATVTSVLLLVQSGKLDLDAPVGEILHVLEGAPIGSATVRDLLTHRSGLPGWRPLYERLGAKGVVWGRSELVRQTVLLLIRDEPLIYGRGERSEYSDLGFILLGFAIEQVSGKPLDEFFYESVTSPLGAHALCFNPTVADSHAARPAVDASTIAPTEWDERRQQLLKGHVHDENAAAMGGVAGHAGLFGTAEAVLAVSGAWLRSHDGQQSILDHRLVREFTGRRPSSLPSSWALGWDTPTTPSSSGSYLSPESFGHLGYTGTSVWIDPRQRLEVVLLSNRVHPTRKNEAIRAFRPLVHDLVFREIVQRNG